MFEVEGSGVMRCLGFLVTFVFIVITVDTAAAQRSSCDALAAGLAHVEQDRPMRAADAFKSAIDGGHPLAEFQLGTLYYHGRGTFQDREKAVALWQRAATDRFGPAAYLLARAYAHGIGVEQKANTARFWLAAADVLVTDDSPFRERVDRSVRAMRERLGDDDTAAFRRKVVEWLREREPSFPECESTLVAKRPTDLLPERDDGGTRVGGNGDGPGDGGKISKAKACKATKLGVKAYKQDSYRKAAKAFKAALPLGHPSAEFYLGRMFQDGKGVEARPEQGVALMKRAAADGVGAAAALVHHAYLKETGIGRDLKRSVKWAFIAETLLEENSDQHRAISKFLKMVKAEVADAAFSRSSDEAEQWLRENRTEPPDCGSVRVAKKPDGGGKDGRQEGTSDGGGELRLRGTGTGFYVSEQGHILTNNHVIAKCDAVQVRHLGRKPRPARIISRVPEKRMDKTGKPDLGLLKVDGDPHGRVARFRTHDSVQMGMKVFAFGFPLGQVFAKNQGRLNHPGRLTDGVISQMTSGMKSTAYGTTAPIQSGNSGGPLVDKNGFVVGVVVARIPQEMIEGEEIENARLAVKGPLAQSFLRTNGIDVRRSDEAVRDNGRPPAPKIARDISVQILCLQRK